MDYRKLDANGRSAIEGMVTNLVESMSEAVKNRPDCALEDPNSLRKAKNNELYWVARAAEYDRQMASGREIDNQLARVGAGQSETVFRIQQNSASVTIYANGAVEISPGLQVDDAARLFWSAVEKRFPHSAVLAEREKRWISDDDSLGVAMNEMTQEGRQPQVWLRRIRSGAA